MITESKLIHELPVMTTFVETGIQFCVGDAPGNLLPAGGLIGSDPLR